MAKINIKDHPELRHALAHIYYAIEAVSQGNCKEARYELESIEGLIFWEDDEHMTRHLEGKKHASKKESTSA